MSLNPFAFAGLLLGFTCLVVTIILVKFGKSHIHRTWALFNIAVAVWGIGAFLIGTATDITKAEFYWKLAHVGIIFIPVFLFHVIYILCDLNQKKLLFSVYFLASIFLLLNLFAPKGVFTSDLYFAFSSFYYASQGYTYIYFFIFWSVLVLYSHFRLFLIYRNSHGTQRNQILYFFLGVVAGFSGGITNFLPVFGIPLYPFGNFTIPLYCIIVTYAILKYKLLDIKLTITRAGLFIFVYTIILGIPFAITGYSKDILIKTFGSNWWIWPLGLMSILATVGPFLYIRLQQKAEDRLLHEQRRYQNTLKHAAIGMTRIRSLIKLLTMITHIVTKTVRISFAAIYLHDRQTNEYSLQVFRGKNQAPLATLSSDSTLVKWLSQKREPLIYEEVKRQMQDSGDNAFKALEANMRLLNASVIIPILLDHTLTGFVILGDKLSGQMYTPEDLSVFQVLASQAALAIENAQFYEEAKEMQAQIGQAEKMATIGTMADGLSHQINNRFYALSLISGDSIDTIKMTDTSGCSPEIKAMISQIYAALERIQSNVMQGGEVVKGILKYTRKGDEGLEPLTIDQVLDGTIDMVQFKVKLSEIDIIRNYPKEIPKVKANLVQMQEVFFNFIDNAYDAIVERRTTLKEENYRGSITITAAPKDNVMQIIVQDNGMGVRSEDVKKIFTPFFTTKASSRKGTGLGLYVIRSIILETHKGTINFHSEYRAGTRFTIEIPLSAQV